jgi:hypothetical protein
VAVMDDSNLPSKGVAASPSRFWGSFTTYDAFRIVVGLLLIVAAGLKAYKLATAPVPETGVLTSRWLLIAVVELEFGLGLALVARLWLGIVWPVAILTFGVFATISLYRGAAGADSCGCLGVVTTSPWTMLIVDLAVFVCLLRFRPLAAPIENPQPVASLRPQHSFISAVVFLAFGVPGAIAMARLNPTSLRADGDFSGDSSIVVIEPEKWVGKPFPLSIYIDVGPQLSRGRWTVILHHHDCPKCQELVTAMEAGFASTSQTPRLALIEVPPFGQSRANMAFPTTTVHGRLSPDRDWFVQTPAVIELNEGRVVDSSTGDVSAVKGSLKRVRTQSSYSSADVICRSGGMGDYWLVRVSGEKF